MAEIVDNSDGLGAIALELRLAGADIGEKPEARRGLLTRRDRFLEPPPLHPFQDKRQRERDRKQTKSGDQQFRIEIHNAPTHRASRPILGYRQATFLQPS
jgi:hypothetical protein